jgi:hypothetical protein
MQVKAALQAIMQQWGRPQRLRMDNGLPWGTNSKLPSALGLWLVGLGVELIYGRPARSTDNAVVERGQGVLANWTEPAECPTALDYEAQLAWAAHTQRERYRLADGRTRLQAFPALLDNARPYDPQQDAQLWSLDRVRRYLSGFHFQRKVERNGRITLFANNYSVGRRYARQYVEIHLDLLTDEWVMCDEYGTELRRHPVKELSYELIRQLKLAKRRKN